MHDQPDNIECFSMAARGILRELLIKFPEPIEIHPLALQREMVNAGELHKDCAWERREKCLVDATIEYLVAEGIIRSDPRAAAMGSKSSEIIPVYRWPECCLTSKGFAALNRPLPEKHPADARNTIAKAIKTTGAIAGRTGITEIIRNILQ